jgi:hypothetical protein
MMGEAAEIRAEILRQIDWYEAKGRDMKDSRYQLAFAVVIGATKALRDLLGKLPDTSEAEAVRDALSLTPPFTFAHEPAKLTPSGKG